uniref:Uncharacterized protein n=1 Tax=Panagrolaimus sp. ES5 TaxID=591445 RepID=A0AC34GKI8_9BILA
MLTDEYLQTKILYSTSTSPEIKKAQEILTDISNRKFWRSIVAFKHLDSSIHYPRLEPMEIKAQFRSLDLDFNYNEILVVRKNFNAGKGLNTNPMDLIPFYPGENGESVRYTRFPKPSYQSAIFIIAPFKCTEKDAITINIAIRKYAM